MNKSASVLVVDDNKINSMLICDMLEVFKVTSDMADSGEEAVNLATINDYRFILMDHIMPEMNGAEATRQILSQKEVPVYGVTGEATSEVEMEFLKAGAYDVLEKPLNPRQLMEIVKRHVPAGQYSFPSIGETKLSCTAKPFFEKISELDYDRGIQNAYGNERNYLRILKASSSNIRTYVALIKGYPEFTEVNGLKLAFHSLKSVFASLGIEKLRALAELNEHVADDMLKLIESEVMKEQTEAFAAFVREAEEMADKLGEAMSEYEESVKKNADVYDGPSEELDDEKIREAVQFVNDAINTFEIDYIMQGLDVLRRAMTGERREKIANAIEAAEQFEYDRVKQILDDLNLSGE